MVRQFVLGIDGGQTSTRCVLATTDGHVLGHGVGTGLIHLATEGGPAQFTAALAGAIQAAWEAAGRTPQPVAVIGLGLTGVEADGPEAPLARDLIAQIVPSAHIELHNDAYTALVGAHLGQPGVMVIAGTGSIALGQDSQGRVARAGGWGWLLGDEGSAFAIGRDGVRAALDACDGLRPPTSLQDAFLRYFEVGQPRDIKNRVYASDFGARGFAALAPLVSEAARADDMASQTVIYEAGQALARLVMAVIARLPFEADPIPVAPIGGAFEYVYRLRDEFEAALSRHPSVEVRPPRLPPVYGALLLALAAAGVPMERAQAVLTEFTE
ncbi:MAG: N-acetylglucosamine kinase [Anaerolineae bacterium]|nr:N-acetylglucosamine kinase [Anaerolineae bacterium]